MVNPAIRSALGSNNTGTTGLVLAAPAGIATNDWMVAVIVDTLSTNGTTEVNAPDSSWVVLLPHTAIGTRNMKVFGRRRLSTDGASYTFTQTATSFAVGVIVAGTDGIVDPASWLLGAFQRGGTGSSGTTYVSGTAQQTPSLAGVPAGSVVLSLQGEASAASEADSDVTVASPFAKLLWFIGASSPANSVLVASRTLTSAGATGTADSTWLNATANRGSIMVAIPPIPTSTPTAKAQLAGLAASGPAVVVAGAKAQLARIRAFGTVGLQVIPQAAAVTAEPFDMVAITASVSQSSGAPKSWQWRQVSGIPVGLVNTNDGTVQFKAPAALNAQAVVLGVVAVGADGTQSPEVQFTVNVYAHTIFSLKGGVWTPSELGPVKAQSDVSAPVGDATRNGITREQNLLETFTRTARVGEFRTVYSEMGFYDGFTDTSGLGLYAPDRVLSVQNGILDVNLHVENGQPLSAAIMPDNYRPRLGGRWDVCLRTDSPVDGWKLVQMLWPISDDWNDGEIDWPEAAIGKPARPASAIPGTYNTTVPNGMVFLPPTAQFAPFDTTAFHVYSTEWNYDADVPANNWLRFYADEILVAEITGAGNLPTKPMRATMQFETWENTGAPPSAPAHVYVAYVAGWGGDPKAAVTQSKGISPGFAFQNALNAGGAAAGRTTIQKIADTGSKWMRYDATWTGGTDGAVRAGISDALIAATIAAGMRVSIVLSDGVATGKSASNGFPVWCQAAAAHFAALGVHHFEVQNEPNLGKNWAAGQGSATRVADVVAYTNTLKAVYPKVKAGDPQAVVLMAGLAPYGKPAASPAIQGSNYNPFDFLALMYANGARPFMDAVNFHGYTFPVLPNQADGGYNTMLALPNAHGIMVANGDDGKQIWITEFGVPTGTDGGVAQANVASEAVQAQVIGIVFDMVKAWEWVGPVMHYSWQDSTTDGDYGLVTTTGTAKQSLAAFTSVQGVSTGVGVGSGPLGTTPLGGNSSTTAPVTSGYGNDYGNNYGG